VKSSEVLRDGLRISSLFFVAGFDGMPHLYEFGEFTLDVDRRILLRGGQPVVLAPKVFETLLALVEPGGRTVTREELLDRVWGGAAVEEGGLSRNISILRKALGEKPDEHLYIVTVPGRGYQFAAEVRQPSQLDSAATHPPGLVARRRAAFGRIGARARLGAVIGIAVCAAVGTGYLLTRQTESSTTVAQHLISTFAGSYRAPTLSPDGTRVAFVNVASGSPSQVWITSITDGEPRQVTFDLDAADRPRWSPLGDQIVYTRISHAASGSVQTSIWAVAPDGGAPRKLIDHARNASWSRDGRSLVFERGSDIWTSDADGGTQRRVEGIPPTDLLLSDRTPAFSPDRSHIAFFHPERGPLGDVWIAAAAGGQARRLSSAVARGGGLTWTPDGEWIVFASRHAGSMTLWKVSPKGGKLESVLVGAGEDTDPEFARDGRRLVYTNTRATFVLVVQDASTRRTRELFESRTDVAFPSFSPPGDRIAFFQVTGAGDAHVFTISVQGRDLTQITRGQQHNSLPHWSADDSAIYYYQERPPHTSFRKISLRAGEDAELVKGWTWETQNGARVDPAGRRIIYSTLDRGVVAQTMIRDIASGNETAFTMPLRNPQWSPDGRFVAGVDVSGTQPPMGHITICAVDGGQCRRIARGAIPRWSIDGERLYFLRAAESAEDRALWSISIDGTQETRLTELRSYNPIDAYDVSATGDVVWVQQRRGRSEVWLADFRRP
jgi:Tol biopolymer transport system component/DNA-binding winged helix-turn-helix (wHTH) protein